MKTILDNDASILNIGQFQIKSTFRTLRKYFETWENGDFTDYSDK